jgi:hypothetical protein
VLCLVNRTLIEVECQVPHARFRAFYTLVRVWQVENMNGW